MKKDGTELKGQIVSETATAVVIEVARGGAVIKFPVERSAIVSVEKGPIVTTPPATKPAEEPVPSGPGYYPLPVMGEIGTDVTAASLKEALGHARRVAPAVIVIVFDTEGGDLEEARQIKPELRAAQDTLRDLDAQWNAETRSIENEYRQAARIDNRVSPDRRARLLDDARARRDQKLTLARERFQPRSIEQRERINELAREQQALTKKRTVLVDAAPKVPR